MFSYWEQTRFFANQDILIVGAGFTGLWTALELRKKFPGYRITVLERGSVPVGASTKNAGFCCFGSPTELLENIREYGEQSVWNLVEKRWKGMQKIRNSFSGSAIDYVGCGGYECLANNDMQLVSENLERLNKGLKQSSVPEANCFAFCNEKLKTFGLKGFAGLVENKAEAGIQPVKLLQQLEQKVIAAGIQIFYGITITRMESVNGFIQLFTNQEFQFSGKRVIVCTNAYAKHLIPELDIVPKRGQVLITKEIPGLKLDGCFHYQTGFYYFRNVGNRLLIGGARNLDFENENTDSMEITNTIQDALKEFVLEHLLTDLDFEIGQQWSGIMGFRNFKEPLVKKNSTGIYTVAGMSGMGVALAPVLAEEITAIIAEEE